MSQLREYQQSLADRVVQAWVDGMVAVLMLLPTGGGKTVVLAWIVRNWQRIAAMLGRPVGVRVIAHRQELVVQLSVQLAREGVWHDVIAPDSVRRDCVRAHMEDVGRSFIRPGSTVKVAGVDTLVRREEAHPDEVGLVIVDEGHHVLRKNKWGQVVARYRKAAVLLPTATPTRADGCGLGSHSDGIADIIVKGPSQRWLIDAGFLTPYRVKIPPNSIDLSAVGVGSTGDFNQAQVRTAVHKASITGDVVHQYLKWAKGRTGITFCVDVAAATETAAKYREAGVPAEVVSAKTPDPLRRALVRKLRNRELLQLVNVDLFGEGFDLPAIEVVSMARPTQSFSLYSQQFGRALRIMPGKTEALIIDHVGNVGRHNGPPELRTHWTLDAREKRGKSEPTLIRVCVECLSPYERELTTCPYCGAGLPEPAARTGPEFVDGDLTEIDPAWLADRAREIARINGEALVPQHLTGGARGGALKAHRERREAHEELRHVMGTWAATQAVPLPQAYRRFYLTFGVDTATAQTLSRPDAEDLRARIEARITADGFVINREESVA